MRVLQLYNNYRSGGGGETVMVHRTAKVLAERGHEVRTLERTSTAIHGLLGKTTSALTGVYSLAAKHEIAATLRSFQPDIVHVHNLYPLLTPSVLVACREQGIPTVMSVHNYGLTCPIQTHLRDGVACRLCQTHSDRACITHNFRHHLAESFAYAARHAIGKYLHLFDRNVTLFLPVSPYVQETLIASGIPEQQTRVLLNGVPLPPLCATPATGSYVLYLGRYTQEKGLLTLLEAARRLPGLPFRLHGDGPLLETLRATAPPNVTVGPWLPPGALPGAYLGALCAVVPSLWHEPCPMSALEALSYGLPVVASNTGGLPTLIDDGVTGYLHPPGDVATLAEHLSTLDQHRSLAEDMGRAARHSAEQRFSEDRYAENLLAAYTHAQFR